MLPSAPSRASAHAMACKSNEHGAHHTARPACLLTRAARARGSSGQDLGDGVWPVLAALLPRAAALKVSAPSPPAPALSPCAGAPWSASRSAPRRCAPTDGGCGVAGRGAAGPQVSPDGGVAVVSGVGAKGTSRMALSGGRGLGPEGAGRLAGLLREAPPPLLASLNLR